MASDSLLGHPAEPRPVREEPTWACKRCGRHIPILDGVFAAAIAQFHRQEHVIDDLEALLDRQKHALAACRGERDSASTALLLSGDVEIIS